MAEEETEESRTEEPTAYKLSRARKKGSVARGTDLAFLTGLAAFFGYVSLTGAHAGGEITSAMRRAFVSSPTLAGGSDVLLAASGQVMALAARPVAFLAATVLGVVLVCEIVQTGLIFSSEPLGLDFGRLSPAQNLKRLTSGRVWIETAKTVAKLVVYTGLAFMVIREARIGLLSAITDASTLSEIMHKAVLKLLAYFIAGAAIFAVADQIIARRDFLKRMRMSRREIRREIREREGDGRLKQRRRQLHTEFVKTSKSMRNIKSADVLITNPTHFAVGLRYDPRVMNAPIVVAKGAHQIALRLRRLAFLYSVTIVEDKALARSLFQRGELDREISEVHYRGVADLYRRLRVKSQASGAA